MSIYVHNTKHAPNVQSINATNNNRNNYMRAKQNLTTTEIQNFYLHAIIISNAHFLKQFNPFYRFQSLMLNYFQQFNPFNNLIPSTDSLLC
jgi:hypothetical protein